MSVATRARTKRKQPERATQSAIVAYIAAVAPHVVCYAVPNGIRRTRSGGIASPLPGSVNGVPDLALVSVGRAYFLEVKAPKGTTSDEQKATIARLRKAGAGVEVVRSIDDVERALAAWGIPTRKANTGQWFPVPATSEQMEDAE